MCECNCEDCPWLNLFIVVVTHHVIKIVYHLQVVFNADVFIGTMHTLLFGVINFNGHKTIDMITESAYSIVSSRTRKPFVCFLCPIKCAIAQIPVGPFLAH